VSHAGIHPVRSGWDAFCILHRDRAACSGGSGLISTGPEVEDFPPKVLKAYSTIEEHNSDRLGNAAMPKKGQNQRHEEKRFSTDEL